MKWLDRTEWTPPFGLGKGGPVGVFTDENEFTLFFADPAVPEDSGQDPATNPAQLFRQGFTIVTQDGLTYPAPTGDLLMVCSLPHMYAPIRVQETPDGHYAIISQPSFGGDN